MTETWSSSAWSCSCVVVLASSWSCSSSGGRARRRRGRARRRRGRRGCRRRAGCRRRRGCHDCCGIRGGDGGAVVVRGDDHDSKCACSIGRDGCVIRRRCSGKRAASAAARVAALPLVGDLQPFAFPGSNVRGQAVSQLREAADCRRGSIRRRRLTRCRTSARAGQSRTQYECENGETKNELAATHPLTPSARKLAP